jgi:hypothetical protein
VSAHNKRTNGVGPDGSVSGEVRDLQVSVVGYATTEKEQTRSSTEVWSRQLPASMHLSRAFSTGVPVQKFWGSKTPPRLIGFGHDNRCRLAVVLLKVAVSIHSRLAAKYEIEGFEKNRPVNVRQMVDQTQAGSSEQDDANGRRRSAYSTISVLFRSSHNWIVYKASSKIAESPSHPLPTMGMVSGRALAYY